MQTGPMTNRVAALVAAVALAVTMSSCGTTVHASSPAHVGKPAASETTNSTLDSTDDPVMTVNPEWNCLTMGDHSCGMDWQPIDNPDATGGRKACLVQFGDTSFVVCPDGYVSES